MDMKVGRGQITSNILRYLNIIRYALWFNAIELILQLTNITANYLVYLFVLSPLTGNQILSQAFGIAAAIAIGYAIRRFEKTGKLELALHRDRRIPKRTFTTCKLVRNWNEYFRIQLGIQGISCISYPESDSSNKFSIPAYEIARFVNDRKGWPVFADDGKRNTGNISLFRDRYTDDAETEDEARNKFTKQDIEDFRTMIRGNWWNGKAVWVTGISFVNGEPLISYTVTQYYSSLVLVNKIAYMIGMFPREQGFPIFAVESQLHNLKQGKFDELFNEIPAILGVEVIVITKDNKLLLQRRSSKEAVRSRTNYIKRIFWV